MLTPPADAVLDDEDVDDGVDEAVVAGLDDGGGRLRDVFAMMK